VNIKKPEAMKLREAGYSYAMIKSELGISLSTLSSWFKDKPFTPSQAVLKRIRTGQYSYGARRKKERAIEINTLKAVGLQEVGILSKRDLWMVGLGLWIGEGSKTTEQLRLANSDPQVIALWVHWLKEICGFQGSDIFLTLHLYDDSNEEQCKKYWKKVVGMQDIRFGKSQIDKRQNKIRIKKGKLPYGTVHVSVRSNGNPEKGVRLYRRFKGWISAILEIT
jgi:hypothetical protein